MNAHLKNTQFSKMGKIDHHASAIGFEKSSVWVERLNVKCVREGTVKPHQGCFMQKTVRKVLKIKKKLQVYGCRQDQPL